jgi:hypothetical protein
MTRVSADMTGEGDVAAGEICTYSLTEVAEAHLPRELKDPALGGMA